MTRATRRPRAAFAALLLVGAAAASVGVAADDPPAKKPPAADPTAKPDAKPAEPEAKIEVLATGAGREVKKADQVLVHLVIQLADTGKTLVDTRAEGDPQVVVAGGGHVAQALDDAVLKMRVGDRWKITAPYRLAWGERGYPGCVPARSDVVFDAEVVGFLEMKTEVIKSGSGPTPAVGEFVLLHYAGALADGKPIEDTRKDDAPVVVTMGAGRIAQGWELTLRKMRVGDRWKVWIPWQLAFGVRGQPPSIPPRADVVYEFERLPLPDVTLESVVVEGKGAPCALGRTVTVHYVGTLGDGRKFDSSRDRGEPFSFVLGGHDVIPGWEILVSRMRVGDRWKVLVPWQLAFGAKGQTASADAPALIPKKADLHFDIEILGVK